MSRSLRRLLKEPTRKVLIVYLAAIVAPTLALLIMGVRSVGRERRALREATDTSLQLSAEKVVTEMEDVMRRTAGEQLYDLSRDLDSVLPEEFTLQSASRLRVWLDQHRVGRYVDQFYLIERGAVTFPILHVAPVEPAVAMQDRFAAAEQMEMRDGRPDLALDAYHRLQQSAAEESLKALSLWRSARCLKKLQRDAAAAAAYRELVTRFASEYDRFQRPYGLLATFELGEAQRLRAARRSFAQGQWEMPADNVTYFAQRFRERLGDDAQDDTGFLRQFEMVQLLQTRFRYDSHLYRGKIYCCALPQKPFTQIFYTPIDTTPGKERLLAFTVRLDVAATGLVQDARHFAGVEADVKVVERGTPAGSTGPRASFRYLFPFWQVEVAPPPSLGGWRSGALVFEGMTLFVLLALITGVILIVRDNWRQWEANQLRTSLVGGISHNLKTPLTAIRLYADILAGDGGLTAEERKDYSTVISRESERLDRLIENVLDFSRTEKGKRDYRFEEGDITPAVASITDMYRTYWGTRGFSIHTDFAPNLPSVRFDPEAVSQAILNLLDNAVKYSGDARDIEVELGQRDSNVVLSVTDHGIGIAPADHDRIFEEFYRASPQMGKGGAGLGLYLVRHIMDAHGGFVTLDSELGRGSRFRLLFPLAWPKS